MKEAPRPFLQQDMGYPVGPGNDSHLPSNAEDDQSWDETAPHTPLEEAAREVWFRCFRDAVNYHEGIPIAQNDQRWEETAEQFPQYGTRIRELRRAMVTAYKTLKMYDDEEAARYDGRKDIPLRAELGRQFRRHIEDEGVQVFLTDILLARVSVEEGGFNPNFNYRFRVATENQMATELGLPGKWDQQAHTLTLENVIGAVLEGRLQVLPQPLQPEPPAAQ